MKVENMTSSNGNKVANQFIIVDGRFEYLQSYNKIIAKRDIWNTKVPIQLDKHFWDFSKTTGKYRNQFLGETKAETQKKIDSGEYVLTDLN